MPELVSISLDELVFSLANLMDRTIAPLRDHHRRTAIAAYHISEYMPITAQQRRDLVFAAAIHDIGAFSIEEQQALSDLRFEYQYINRHAKAAWLLFQQFPPFNHLADILRYHHAYMNIIDEVERKIIPIEAYILQVADHVAVLTSSIENILDKSGEIGAEVESNSGILFDPAVVEAFKKASVKENYWLDIQNLSLDVLFRKKISLDLISIKSKELFGLVNLFRRIIDFRSRFTSTHTAGVGAVAAEMAILKGLDEEIVRKVKIAGYLHDIGKLTVSSEILDKPGFLTHEEFNIIRGHTYFTNEFLSSIEVFSEIGAWASQHHERLNGRGYPFHFEQTEICTESRILAIADVFTALTEDRPYRKGVPAKEAMIVLNVGVQKREMDAELIELLNTHLEQIDQIRKTAQDESRLEYERFIEELTKSGY